MPDPLVLQGNLQRIKASLIWNDFPDLNVTPSFLAREMFTLAFEGEATTVIPTGTGLVNSPEPFQSILVTMALLKTQPLSQAYENKRLTNTLMGNGTLRPDVSSGGLGPYSLLNMSIRNIAELTFRGDDAAYRITLGGYYIINSNLWD
jgi:hypothetical protein